MSTNNDGYEVSHSRRNAILGGTAGAAGLLMPPIALFPAAQAATDVAMPSQAQGAPGMATNTITTKDGVQIQEDHLTSACAAWR
jgi:hypothetical protein